MALRRCAALAPRLLRNSPALPGAPVPGRTSASSPVITDRRCKAAEMQHCRFSAASSSAGVNYEQLKRLLAGRKAVVIDVREPSELMEYGHIPGSINVPLGQVNTALQLAQEEFHEKYGAVMPQQTDNIVFTCRSGVRSLKALDTAVSLGYKDVQNYLGGWLDWEKNEQQK
ncbi:thiosulfate sulfurtransferase/rhodanese-like domain-containing protein 3 [Gasterosteus aculeatus]|nr:thiosulfate sulfurtransferase/rhodanese-like domain-containing protein 3 [Gasterosteus aculeatus aculeatus]